MNTVGIILCILALLLASVAQAGTYTVNVKLPGDKTVYSHTSPGSNL